jgi:pimeloyl-ACP methyl ester carboxylesterase
MEDVSVVEWHAKLGEAIKAGQPIVTVETAKAATEITATHDGYLHEIFFLVGQDAPIGSVLGTISETLEPSGEVRTPSGPSASSPARKPPAEEKVLPVGQTRTVASPLARRVAREHGVDLAKLEGNGPRGRIKRLDVERALSTTSVEPAAGPSNQTPALASPRLAPIVLLHGFGADYTSWRNVAPLLNPERRLTLLDLPGHGRAPAVAVRELADLTLVVSEQLQAKGIEDAHVVGHSLGGAIALSLTQLGRLRIHSLCLVAPCGLGSEIDFGFLRGIVTATQSEQLQPWLERMVADPTSVPESFARTVLRRRERSDSQSGQQGILDALFAEGVQRIGSLTAALGAVRVPTKIIWGLADAIIPWKHALTAPGDVGLHLLQNVGHVPQLECPEIVARLINELAHGRS